MKISYNWLKDYLELDMDPAKVAGILTDIGLEVEAWEKTQSVKGGLEGLVVGLVESAEQHPNADRLKVTKVNVGNENSLSIVCGAPNVAAGQKVIVATHGTTIYPTEGEPFKIKKGKIRGEISEGMICAEDEIGLGLEHDGIMVLDEAAKIGVAANQVIKIEKDHIFEIGLTPNRSDATCHIGVAKDLLAALRTNYEFEGSIKMPDVDGFEIDNRDLPISVVVEDAKACPRYAGVSISNVKVQASPDWLQNKLKAIGLRPINNIVDITNFILHEIGQPLHAFDADQIKGGTVVVKQQAEGTAFVSLDEIERKLSAEDLMICDAQDGMCIAGVFGGLSSGVKDETTNIFLESACFDPISIRRTATRHNLRTDAAMRFEKGVDPNVAVYALKRAAMLIKELAGGSIASGIVDVYPEKIARPQVRVSSALINRLAGIDIASEQVSTILRDLEMEIVEENGGSWLVKVPTNKTDVLREVDVIEEILRIYGYNQIPIPTELKSTISHTQKPNRHRVQNIVSDFLANNGFNEMMANSISNSKYYVGSDEESSVVPLLNSLNSDLDVLRKDLLFSGLEALLRNKNRKQENLKFFEFGTSYEVIEGQYGERENLSLFMMGDDKSESWKAAGEKVNFFHLKTQVQAILNRLGLTYLKNDYITDDPFAFGLKYFLGPKEFVRLGRLKPAIAKKMGLSDAIYHAIFNWDLILKELGKKGVNFQPLTKYPQVRRDLALLLDDNIKFGQIEQIGMKVGKKLLQSVNLFDIYRDDKIGKNKKSYAVSFVFQDDRKTLTDKEVDQLMSKMIYVYQNDLGASLR